MVLGALVLLLGLQPNWLIHYSETTTATLLPARLAIAQTAMVVKPLPKAEIME
jgi:hypothetical protein